MTENKKVDETNKEKNRNALLMKTYLDCLKGRRKKVKTETQFSGIDD